MKPLRVLTLVLALLLLAACFGGTPGGDVEPTASPVAPQPAETPAAAAPAPGEGLPLPTARGRFFSASGQCTACHTKMVDESGADVSVDSLWRPTLMANAARDPFWQAVVRAELLSSPSLEAVIENKCSTCHTPMASFTVQQASPGETGQGDLLDGGFLSAGHELHTLGVDGVSCSLCHQVRSENFGQAESFSGGYQIDAEQAAGERTVFGPYPVEPDQVAAMQAGSGFIPEQGLHIEEADLCGTCHTLYTPYLDAQGQVAGEFPEQMIYPEWAASRYRTEQSCQGCHMPLAQGGVRISITGGPARSPFYQHVFVGGNADLQRIFIQNGDDLQATASRAQFERALEATLEQLESRSAVLKLVDAHLEGGQLSLSVELQSLAGHKFPAGFPSRRAWLHLSVVDASGQLLFESGAAGSDGTIAGNDNDADPAKFEPHYTAITEPDQVQIYEAVLKDTEGEVTTVLLRAAGYAKDNRLLPAGFDKDQAEAEIAPDQAAAGDEDFLSGGDRVAYALDLGEVSGPLTVQVELLYQTVGFRWVEHLSGFDAPEPQRFREYNTAAAHPPVRVALAEVSVGGEAP